MSIELRERDARRRRRRSSSCSTSTRSPRSASSRWARTRFAAGSTCRTSGCSSPSATARWSATSTSPPRTSGHLRRRRADARPPTSRRCSLEAAEARGARDHGDADSARVRPGPRAGAPGGLRGRRLARRSATRSRCGSSSTASSRSRSGRTGSRRGTPQPGEEERVYEAHMDAFADHWDFRRQPFEVWRSYTTNTHRYRPVPLVARRGRGRARRRSRSTAWHFSGDPQFGWIQVLGVRPRLAQARARDRAAAALVPRLREPRRDAGRARRGRREHDRRGPALRAASACARSAATTPTRRRCEPAARPLSRLPHLHRGRDRAGLRVPFAAGASTAPGMVRVPQAWGEGGESMAEAARLPLPYPGGRRRRGGDARRADAGGGDRPAGAPARARRLLLLAHRRGRGAGRSQRPDRAGLDRRPRRPEHGRELAVREPVGDAVPDDPRLRRGRPAGRDPARRAEPRPARARVHRLDRPAHRRRRARGSAGRNRRRLCRPRRRRARAGRDPALHARARRAHARRGRAALRAGSASGRRSWARASAPPPPSRRTSSRSRGWRSPWGCNSRPRRRV